MESRTATAWLLSAAVELTLSVFLVADQSSASGLTSFDGVSRVMVIGGSRCTFAQRHRWLRTTSLRLCLANLKILHVSHGYLPESAGGVELYLRDVIAAQKRLGHDVSLLSGSLQIWERAGLEELHVGGVEVLRLHRQDSFFDHYAHGYNLDAERLIVEVLGRVQPDIVHVHHWIRLTSNLVELAEAQDIPTVVTLHDVHTSCPRTFRVHRDGSCCFHKLSAENCVPCVPRFGHEPEAEVVEAVRLFGEQLRSELSRARRVLVALGTTADHLSEMTGMPRSRYEVMSLAYQRRFGRTGQVPPRPEGERPFRFGYWGSITPQKGSHVLVRAFREAVARCSDPLELHLFGPLHEDTFTTDLRQDAADLPITLHGRYDAQDLVHAHLDAAVFPALCFETFSLSLTECFELRLPSIVSDIGALPARAGGAAIVVPAGDVRALATAIVEMASRPDLRRDLRDRIPPLPPGPDEHARELLAVYAQARSISSEGHASPGRERWLRFLDGQRASAEAAGRGPRDPRPPS